MSNEEIKGNNGDYFLKPELSFPWIKYKKSEPEQESSEADNTPNTYESIKTELTNDTVVKEKDQTKQEQSELQKDSSLTRVKFKADPVKEKLFLWYNELFKSKEMTLEQFSKVIETEGQSETEDFLFRHAPLKYSYLWRGKDLKFSDETIAKLEKELKE